MKKVYMGLIAAVLVTGCASTTSDKIPANGNLIKDPQFTTFRLESGSNGVWQKELLEEKEYGHVGSSKDTAFGEDGCVRLRFTSKNAHFSAQPAISQTVDNIQKNSNYELSMYLSDKKGVNSVSTLILEISDTNGDLIDRQEIHTRTLATAPRGEVKKHFRQILMNFNSGDASKVKITAKLKITDPSKIDLAGDIGKQTEIRLDEFSLVKK